jgi:hypothetical protein
MPHAPGWGEGWRSIRPEFSGGLRGLTGDL